MKILSICIKDLKILFRDVGGMTNLFLMPLAFIFILTFALGGQFGGSEAERKTELPVVYKRSDKIARQIVKELKKTKGFEVEDSLENKPLTYKQALELVRNGDKSAALIFPSNFTKRLVNWEKVQLKLFVDPAVSEGEIGGIKGTLEGLLQNSTMTLLAEQGAKEFFDKLKFDPSNLPPEVKEGMKSIGIDPAKISPRAIGKNIKDISDEPPATIKEVRPPGMKAVKNPTAVQQNVPGYTSMFVFFIVLYIALSFLAEKQAGTFRRLQAAPIGKSVILAGKLLPYYLVNLMQIVIMFAFGRFVFNMSLGHSLLGLILLSLAVSAAATSLGLMVASLAKTGSQISGLGVLLVLSLSAIGGTMVPLFLMPDFMQQIAKISPINWALTGYQDILVRGYGLAEVVPEIGVLLAFAAVFFAIALWRFKFD